jgi:hypothetical protein
MPDVFAWPPVQLVGHEHTISRPIQRAEGLSGTAQGSQSEPTRRMVRAAVAGIGTDGAGAGYIEMLKHLMDGKLAFVRMTPLPQHWIGAVRGMVGERGGEGVNWATGGVDLNWQTNGVDLLWASGRVITAVAGADTWPFLDCSGFQPNKQIAVPSELVAVAGQTARVLRVARSDGAGNARVYLATALPSGTAVFGVRESMAFEIVKFPRAMQPLSGNYRYDFELREVFASEYLDGFNEVSPWT